MEPTMHDGLKVFDNIIPRLALEARFKRDKIKDPVLVLGLSKTTGRMGNPYYVREVYLQTPYGFVSYRVRRDGRTEAGWTAKREGDYNFILERSITLEELP
jgi:hypothetical protein